MAAGKRFNDPRYPHLHGMTPAAQAAAAAPLWGSWRAARDRALPYHRLWEDAPSDAPECVLEDDTEALSYLAAELARLGRLAVEALAAGPGAAGDAARQHRRLRGLLGDVLLLLLRHAAEQSPAQLNALLAEALRPELSALAARVGTGGKS